VISTLTIGKNTALIGLLWREVAGANSRDMKAKSLESRAALRGVTVTIMTPTRCQITASAAGDYSIENQVSVAAWLMTIPKFRGAYVSFLIDAGKDQCGLIVASSGSIVAELVGSMKHCFEMLEAQLVKRPELQSTHRTTLVGGAAFMQRANAYAETNSFDLADHFDVEPSLEKILGVRPPVSARFARAPTSFFRSRGFVYMMVGALLVGMYFVKRHQDQLAAQAAQKIGNELEPAVAAQLREERIETAVRDSLLRDLSNPSAVSVGESIRALLERSVQVLWAASGVACDLSSCALTVKREVGGATIRDVVVGIDGLVLKPGDYREAQLSAPLVKRTPLRADADVARLQGIDAVVQSQWFSSADEITRVYGGELRIGALNRLPLSIDTPVKVPDSPPQKEPVPMDRVYGQVELTLSVSSLDGFTAVCSLLPPGSWLKNASYATTGVVTGTIVVIVK